MKKLVISALLLVFLAPSIYAIDEDTYVRFVADSIVVSYKVKGNPNADIMWSDEMKRLYPGVTSQDIMSYEAVLSQNGDLKTAVYNKILENVRAKGYKANISGSGAGTNVVIES